MKLRPLQREAINAALMGHSVFLQLATGGGKSLCFVAAGMCLITNPVLKTSVVIVITPLVALMNDQIRRLDAAGIPSIGFAGHMKIDTLTLLKGFSLSFCRSDRD